MPGLTYDVDTDLLIFNTRIDRPVFERMLAGMAASPSDTEGVSPLAGNRGAAGD